MGKNNLPYCLEIISAVKQVIKFLLKIIQTQNYQKMSHFSCLQTTLHLHLLPNPQCIIWAAITLCFMPWSDKWETVLSGSRDTKGPNTPVITIV